ncbi:MAG: WD40/YVTN/BNR-like repeat-containing protein, partial [Saprospiraceae bacterium]
SPVDKDVIWVGTDDGNLQLTKDGGKNWDNLSNQLPDFPKGAWIPQIEVSKKNAGEAFVIVNDYRRNNWSAYAYHTTNFGASWNRIVNDRQVKGHALSIVQDPIEENLLFLGTDYGLYFSIDKGQNWNKWMKDFPAVSTRDLKIHEREHDLIVGTFGRAAWIMDDIRPFREIAKTNGKVLLEEFKVFEASDAWLADYKSVDGIRFVADAVYRAKNRSTNAMITLWNKPIEKKNEKSPDSKSADKKEKNAEEDKTKKSKWKKDKLYVQVLNEAGDTIRTFSEKIDTGMVRIYWGLERNGIRFPSYRDAKPDSDPPRGPSVLPGRYKLVLTYNEHFDSTYVNVKMDPRSNSTLTDLENESKAIDNFYKTVEKTTIGFDRLKEAKKTIKLVNDQMINAPDSTKENIKKLGTAMQDSIKNLMKLYVMPQGLKGIQRNPNNLNGYIWNTYSYIRASDGKPNQMAEYSTKKLNKEIKIVIDQVNKFFSEDWDNYQKEVEKANASLFKKYDLIEIE